MRRVLLPTLLVVALGLPAATPSLSALRIGTNGPDTLLGTTGNDQLTGKRDRDELLGRAGNDVYYFGDNFSRRANGSLTFDTLVEQPGEGFDTVNFRGVTTGPVSILMTREWTSLTGYRATGPGGEVRFTFNQDGTPVKSFIEQAIAGQGNGDLIETGGGSQTLQPGGGANDVLFDYGGWDDGGGPNPEIAPSDDVYKGFADNTGTDQVGDWGGTADVLDMRPFRTDEVYLDAIDLIAGGGDDSLQIVTGPQAQVTVIGHFGSGMFASQGGRIEQIIFADETITDAELLSTASVASLSPKQQRLAEAAPRLAREARAQLARHDRAGRSVIGTNEEATARGDAVSDAPRAETKKGKKSAKADKKRRDRQGKSRQHRRR